ncbi:MAG: BON domain-containing protein [Armatimonadota bacterium]
MGYRDMDLDDQVRAAIRRDEHLASLRIDVRVRNGIVYLTGAVPAAARDHALRTVRSLQSVAAVVDQLHVAG